jgi:cyclopropane fatty-acyl-phospholipid synthase-like methyltransferase
MPERLSPRLKAILEALPLAPGMRVLEVGCGPGALARAMSSAIGDGHVLGIDRSDRAILQAIAGSGDEISAGRLFFRTVAAEDFVIEPGEAPFDLVVAVRVGALDGRHPKAGARAWPRLRAALAPGGRIFVDGVEIAGKTPR